MFRDAIDYSIWDKFGKGQAFRCVYVPFVIDLPMFGAILLLEALGIKQ